MKLNLDKIQMWIWLGAAFFLAFSYYKSNDFSVAILSLICIIIVELKRIQIVQEENGK